MRDEVDVCVIGGGIIGLFCALNLINSGARVRLIDKQYAGSSRFNLGDIILQGYPEDLLPLAALSRERWKFAAEQFGHDVGYTRDGGFRLALSRRDEKKIKESIETEQKLHFESEWIEEEERIKSLMEIEALPLGLRGVKYSLHDASIDMRIALDEVRRLLIQKGALIWGSDDIGEFIKEEDKIVGVRTTTGDECYAKSILISSGIKSPEIFKKIDISLPIRPARSHILELIPTGNMPKQTIDRRERYGDIMIKYMPHTGHALVSYSGLRDPAQATYSLNSDPELIQWLRFRAGKMLPQLENAVLKETHVMTIGVTPDRRPYVGQIQGHDNIFVAAGMNGRSYAFAAGIAYFIGSYIRGDELPLSKEHRAAIEPKTSRFKEKKQRIENIRNTGGVHF